MSTLDIKAAKNGSKTVLIHKPSDKTPKDLGIKDHAQPIPLPKLYHIFHSVSEMYMFTEHEDQTRKYAASICAYDLEDAFRRSQNDIDGNTEYQKYNVRSCSVGDLIQDNEGFYMVCESGFRLVCLLETGHD